MWQGGGAAPVSGGATPNSGDGAEVSATNAQQQQQQEGKQQGQQEPAAAAVSGGGRSRIAPVGQPDTKNEADEKRAARERKRGKVAQEIIVTERTYVSQLHAIVDVYLGPLRAKATQPNPPVAADQIYQIFSNIEQLVPVNDAMLTDFQKAETGDGGDKGFKNLGQVIFKYANFLKTYAPFINNYENMLTVLDSHMKKEDFMYFIQDASKDSRCGGLNLQSLLITPVQRIPRYKLLFEELLKYTDEEEEEYNDIKRGLETVSEVAKRVNTAVLEKERRDKLMELENRFAPSRMGRIKLVEPNRWFLREGTIQKMCRKGPKKFEFFLLNDTLLYANINTSGQLNLHRTLPLGGPERLTVDEVMDIPKYKDKFGFHIKHKTKSFLVMFDERTEKYEWLSAIRDAQDKLLDNEKKKNQTKLKHGLKDDINDNDEDKIKGNVAPVWVPDHLATNCKVCEAKFTMFKRKHHCRRCGQVICAPCSSTKYKIPELSNDKIRVCNSCIEDLVPKQEEYLQNIGRGPREKMLPHEWNSGYERGQIDQARYDWDGYTQYQKKYEDIARERYRELRDSPEALETDSTLIEVSYQAGYVQAGYDDHMHAELGDSCPDYSTAAATYDDEAAVVDPVDDDAAAAAADAATGAAASPTNQEASMAALTVHDQSTGNDDSGAGAGGDVVLTNPHQQTAAATAAPTAAAATSVSPSKTEAPIVPARAYQMAPAAGPANMFRPVSEQGTRSAPAPPPRTGRSPYRGGAGAGGGNAAGIAQRPPPVERVMTAPPGALGRTAIMFDSSDDETDDDDEEEESTATGGGGILHDVARASPMRTQAPSLPAVPPPAPLVSRAKSGIGGSFTMIDGKGSTATSSSAVSPPHLPTPSTSTLHRPPCMAPPAVPSEPPPTTTSAPKTAPPPIPTSPPKQLLNRETNAEASAEGGNDGVGSSLRADAEDDSSSSGLDAPAGSALRKANKLSQRLAFFERQASQQF